MPWIWEDNTIALVNNDSGGTNASTTFTFDNIFKPTAQTVDLFDAVAAPVVDSAMAGFNATIFAYGQTSSGKT